MTYQSSEESVASGQPNELYDIAYGDTHWRLTSSDESKIYDGNTCTKGPCKRTEIEQTGEIPKDALELELPRNHALGLLCIAGPPEEEVTLTIYRGHGAFYVTHFKGFLTNVTMDGEFIPKCTFEPRSSDLPFVGGRRRAMRLCGHLLYGYRCAVDKDLYKIEGTIEEMSDDGLTITSSDFIPDSGQGVVDEPAVYGDLTKLEGCTYAASAVSGDAYKAFDGNVSTDWKTSPASYVEQENNWIYCKWTSPQKITKIRIRPGNTFKYVWSTTGAYLTYPGEGCMKHFRVAGSNDGSAWTTIPITEWLGNCDLYEGEGGSDTQVDEITNKIEWITVYLANTNTYTYYRIWIYDYWQPSYVWYGWPLFVNEIEMIEADNAMEVFSFSGGGVIQVGSARRMITSQVNDVVIINRKFGSDVTAGSGGSLFVAWPGCNHTPDICRTKFDNMINYGGQEHLPVKNPYKGDLIY